MFDFVHEKKRLVQIVLLLVVLPFAFWGVDSYRKSGTGDALATVDGQKITPQEFDNALRSQQDRMRQMTGGNFNPAMFEQPAIKQSILNGLINQRLLIEKAQSLGLTVGDDRLAEVIAGVGAFQADGHFDKKKYKEVLAQQGMTPAIFEARVRSELAVSQLKDGYTQNGYASRTATDNLIRLNEQQREVSLAHIDPARFMKQVNVSDAEVKGYYQKNQSDFKVPERARVEYVIFSADALKAGIAISDDEIKQYYKAHESEFGAPEQRRAAHILIPVSDKATEAQQQAAKAKAEEVLAQVRKHPERFAALAKKYSGDPGSAAHGGDLGFFGKSEMVKPFADAAFKMRPGEISGLVKSEFGYHIIKLIAVKPASARPLAAVKDSIVQRLRQEKAGDKFANLADKFSNTVYEQSDSLKPAADLVKMPVQKSAWLSKGEPGELPWNAKALKAVFSDDVLKQKRNSEAVEIAPDTLLSVRLLDYKPATTKPLSEVAAEVRLQLKQEKAAELARKQGEKLLTQLQHGDKVALTWKSGETVTRARHEGLDGDLVQKVFGVDASKVPAYVGGESRLGGYVLARIDSVKEVGAIDDAKRARYMQQLRRLSGEALFKAFLADAKKKASITMKAFQAANKE